MYRIAVCDDDKGFLSQFSNQLRDVCLNIGQPVSLDLYESAEALLASEKPFDVLFLDIQMGAVSGLDAARQLRERHQNFCLVFLTSMVQYAVDGYDFHAFAFLTKPVSTERLTEKMVQIIAYVQSKKEEPLLLRSGPNLISLSSDGIQYIEVMNHTTRIILSSDQVTCSIPLERLLQQLPSHKFFRCHKSYVVNFRAVRVLGQSDLLMENGDTVPVSKHRRSAMLTAFARFAGGVTQ